jgi:hypothetical protein
MSLSWLQYIIYKYASPSSSAVDPDPDWIRIQWGPWIRIRIRIRNPDPSPQT